MRMATRARRFERSEIMERLSSRRHERTPIVMGGAGTGLVAQALDRAGIDLIMAYNTGPFRMDGHGSLSGYLAYGDANQMSMDLASRVLPVVRDTPVIAGIGAADPYRDSVALIDTMIGLGCSGITNVPTAGLYDGNFRKQIDDTDLGYPREIELIAACAERDVFTVAYVFTPQESAEMALAGADVIGAHVGLTAGGLIGSKSHLDLPTACDRTREMVQAAREVNSRVFVVAHGGPFEDASSVQAVLNSTEVDGYLGASSIERIPVERALTEAVAGFRTLKMDQGPSQ